MSLIDNKNSHLFAIFCYHIQTLAPSILQYQMDNDNNQEEFRTAQKQRRPSAYYTMSVSRNNSGQGKSFRSSGRKTGILKKIAIINYMKTEKPNDIHRQSCYEEEQVNSMQKAKKADMLHQQLMDMNKKLLQIHNLIMIAEKHIRAESKNKGSDFRASQLFLNQKKRSLGDMIHAQKQIFLKNKEKNEKSNHKLQLQAYQNLVESRKDKESLENAPARLQKAKFKSDQFYERIKQQTQLILQQQRIKEQKKTCRGRIDAIRVQLKAKSEGELMHLRILKIQKHPDYLIGFKMVMEGLDKKLALNKAYRLWDKKMKKFSYKDLKVFILIELYSGWRNLLSKLSYQSTQYSCLFGESECSLEMAQNLRSFFEPEAKRGCKKMKRSLVFFSELADRNRQQDIKNELSNFQSFFLRINDITFKETIKQKNHSYLKHSTMEIHYEFEGEEMVATYSIQQYSQISKEQLRKSLKLINDKNNDHRIFCMIEIPRLIHEQDFPRYEEVYELVKKRKVLR